MDEEDDENEGGDDQKDDDYDEAMEDDEAMTRVPGDNGVPPLPDKLQAAKVNGVHTNQ